MEKKQEERLSCFLISPIGDSGSEIRKHADMLMGAIIEPALKRIDENIVVERADKSNISGMITDEIIQKIINFDIVIADLTYLNPNVFYELGIRHSSGKPTIHISLVDTAIPFDNLGHRVIFYDGEDWHSMKDAENRIVESIRETQKSSYSVSNPVTHAQASFKLSSSADPKEKIISDLSNKVETLENRYLELTNYNSRRINSVLSNPKRNELEKRELKINRINLPDEIDARGGVLFSDYYDEISSIPSSRIEKIIDFVEEVRNMDQGDVAPLDFHIVKELLNKEHHNDKEKRLIELLNRQANSKDYRNGFLTIKEISHQKLNDE
ncbi:hypothetical protein [Pyruvatibacter mobilis]|uniref:hypothetical protein n=1 Tax=Pyruvatibacter mobilis TaxID=1712261 RepID=UPI003C7CF655